MISKRKLSSSIAASEPKAAPSNASTASQAEDVKAERTGKTGKTGKTDAKESAAVSEETKTDVNSEPSEDTSAKKRKVETS